MQFSPTELKDKLLGALDQDNNVVDMLAVLEIISVLEKYPITREALEQTRIGKHVNELRKKTNSKDLAKRAKNLVRRWQQLVTGPPQTNAVNGDGGNRHGVAPPSSIPPHLQGAVPGSKPASPALCSRPGTPSSGKSNLSPASIPNSGTATPGSRPGTPSGVGVQNKVSPKLSGARSLHVAKPASPAINSGNNHAGKRGSPPSSLLHNKNSVVHRSNTPTEGLGKTHVANKRKRREEDSACTPNRKVARRGEDSNDATSLNHNHSKKAVRVNGAATNSSNLETSQKSSHVSNTHESGKIPASTRVSPSPSDCDDKSAVTKPGLLARRNMTLPGSSELCDTNSNKGGFDCSTSDRSGGSRLDRTPTVQTPKVKTTAQLIKELYASGDLRTTASETMTKIALNQIEKEEDECDVSIVPAEAKPRPRRKPGTVPPPERPNESLSKTKSEMVQKFLQSSITPSSSELELANMVDKDGDSLIPNQFGHKMLPDIDRLSGKQRFNNGRHRAGDEPDSGLQFNSARILGEEGTVNGGRAELLDISDPWSLLPPLDTVNLEEEEYEPPVVPEPDETTVDRLHADQWSGVNGQFDSNNSWHDWTATYTMPSYHSEPLHLLPYVNIDD